MDASAELSRMQGVINDLRRELARLRPVQPVDPTISEDESLALVPAPQSASVLMSELFEEAHAKRPRVRPSSPPACVMKSLPAFVKGQHMAAMRFTLVEADRAHAARDDLAASVEVVLIVATTLVAQTSAGWSDTKEPVDRTVL